MDIHLLVGTDDGLFEVGPNTHRLLEGHRVNALAREAGDAWAILDAQEVWRAGKGRDWEPMAKVSDLRALCLLPAKWGLLLGTSEAHLLRLEGDALTRVPSFDQIDGREEWFTPWGGPPDTRSLSAGPTGTLFANVHVGGVARSTDGGRGWHPTMDIEVDCHHVLAHPEDASVVLAATGVGLGISTDGGENWKFEKSGLHATYQRAVAVSGERALVSTSRSERGDQAAVYRLTLDGRIRFEKCEDELPKWFADNVDTGCLVAQGRVAGLGTSDGMVFVSADLGERWDLLKDGLPRVRCVVFA